MSPATTPQSPRSASEYFWLCWDVGIVTLVGANLLLIVFDSLFAAGPVAALVEWLSADFHDWYATTIHAHFALIDLGFVAIFALDVLLGWSAAIVKGRYERWYYYPFVHWYDVLGCIPLAEFRWLRVLRIFALGFRLQRIGLIDVRTWAVYATFKKYYDILVEEVSDRVVVNVLGGVQAEMRSGATELPRRIVQEVVRPRHAQLVGALAEAISSTVSTAYAENREEIRAYIRDVVRHTVERNAAARGVERLPLVGDYVIRVLDDTLTDSVSDVLDAAVQGLSDAEYRTLVGHVTDSLFAYLEREPEAGADPTLQDAVIEVIELLKQQVLKQRWRDEYA
ncbi:MAG: hypothetical protein ACPHCJ_03015 [Oceanococcaceae bacterium]